VRPVIRLELRGGACTACVERLDARLRQQAHAQCFIACQGEFRRWSATTSGLGSYKRSCAGQDRWSIERFARHQISLDPNRHRSLATVGPRIKTPLAMRLGPGLGDSTDTSRERLSAVVTRSFRHSRANRLQSNDRVPRGAAGSLPGSRAQAPRTLSVLWR